MMKLTIIMLFQGCKLDNRKRNKTKDSRDPEINRPWEI